MTKVDLNEFGKQLAAGAEKERADRTEQSRKDLELYRESIQKEIQEQQERLDKASEKYFAEEQRKREAIAEAEKQRAIVKAEEEAERTLGVKTEKTKIIDNA